jgi:hypothetical protein
MRNRNQNDSKEYLSGQKLQIDESKSLHLFSLRQFLDGYISFPDSFETGSFSYYLFINPNLEWPRRDIQP